MNISNWANDDDDVFKKNENDEFTIKRITYVR